MLQTTTKKVKGRTEIDQQLKEAIDDLQTQSSNARSQNENAYFIKNIAALQRVLRLLLEKRLKYPDWKDLFLSNLKICLNQKNHESIIFYFKTVKQFWLSISHSLQAFISSIQKVQKGHFSSNSRPSFQLSSLLIDYNIKTSEDKKFHFIEKVIYQECQYFAMHSEPCQQLFNHYLAYCKAMGIITIFLYASEAYLRYIINNRKDDFQPKFSILRIINQIMEYFSQRDPTSHCCALAANIIIFFSQLLKKQRYLDSLKEFSYNGLDVYGFTDKFLKLAQKIDQTDGYKAARTFIYVIMVSKQQKEILILINPLVENLSVKSTVIDSFIYLASFHHYIMAMKSNVKRQELEAMYDAVTRNIKLMFELGHLTEFTNTVQYIYFDMIKNKNSIYSADVNKSYIYNIDDPTSSSNEKFVKWLPFFQLCIELYEMLQCTAYKDVYKMHLQFKFYMLLAIYAKNNNKNTKKYLLNYLQQDYLKYFQKDLPFISQHCAKLYVLAKFCLSSEYEEIGNRCLTAIIEVIHIGSFASSYCDYGTIFTMMIQERSERQMSDRYHSKRYVFAANAIKLLTLDLIKSFQQFHVQQKTQFWRHYLRQSLEALFYYYGDIEEDCINEILQDFFKLISNYQCFEQITSIIKAIALNSIHQSDFSKGKRQKQLEYLLQFYQKLYQWGKPQLEIRNAINFIDFCFNLKTDFYNMYNLLDSTSIPLKRFVQTVTDRLDEMQMIILDTTAPKYIENLSLSVISGSISNFLDVLSITIKAIFYIVYEQRFLHKISQRNVHEEKIEVLYCFQDELEQSICKLVEVKQKCMKMLPFFRTIYNTFLPLHYIGSIQIRKVSMQKSKHTIAQLNDLMYIAHLSGIDELKQILMSVRLSMVHQDSNYGIFLLEITKYVFLEVFSKIEKKQFTEFLKREILKLGIQNQYRVVIELLLYGQIKGAQHFPNKIFKIFYLLKQNGVTFFNNFREIITYFSYFLFLFPHLPSNLEREKFLIKTTRNAEIESLNEKQYWVKDCWQQGWILTKLIIIVTQKILETAINTNQLSKVRSFLKFSLLLCVRSAHIAELKTSLLLAIRKKEPLNLMKIVDSIKKFESSQIDQSSYQVIDKMIFSKRISISMPHEQSASKSNQIIRLYSKIENSFNKCAKTGSLLAEIFCHLASSQLNLNAFNSFFQRCQLPLLQTSRTQDDEALHSRLKVESGSLNQQLQFIQQLTQQLISIIFTNYQRAVILKDFISQLIDLALEDNNIQSFSAKNHRIIDQIIAKIALSFEGYNYTVKKLLQRLPKISVKEKDPLEVARMTDSALKEYDLCQQKFNEQVQQELLELRTCNYPVSLIFPMGMYLFTISFRSVLLVTFTNRYLFEDKIQQCEQLIESNDKLLKEGINKKANANKRQGLDRQLGKMCEKIDIGILDLDFQFVPRSLVLEYENIDANILKFACNESQASESHFKVYASRFRLNAFTYFISAKEKLKNRANSNENLLLLIHEKYLQFPFELIKSVRQGRGIYRLPSIRYLLENQHRGIEYNIKKCKFLVNTKKDLPQTELRFQKIKNKFSQWIGIKGKIPELIQIQMLLNQQLFLYMGHGTGLEHLKDQDISLLQPSCPMLVFGCNSAKMIFESTQPFGSAYTLLMKGCPAYMGCLWAVTDLDIDRVTEEIFLYAQHDNLSLILQSARRKCTCPHVNGSSTVVYGLPVHLIR